MLLCTQVPHPERVDSRSFVTPPEIACSALENAGVRPDPHRSSIDERPALRLEGLRTLLRYLLRGCGYGSGF